MLSVDLNSTYLILLTLLFFAARVIGKFSTIIYFQLKNMIILGVGGVDIIGHSLRRTSFHIQTILSMPLSSGAEDVLRAYNETLCCPFQ